jgi:dTDP-glucose pyrophosphorylase/CBS domain-containing protein
VKLTVLKDRWIIMQINPEDLQVKKGATLKETIEVMDRQSAGVALIVDEEERLAGILTDGDIRRAILRNVDLATPVEEVMNKNPITATGDFSKKQLLHIIQCRSISHLPIVDSLNRVVRMVFAHDFIRERELQVKAVVMAGGLGSRLRPLTDKVPKPLLKVGSKPILEVIIEGLKEAGIKDIYLSVRYKSEQIEEHFKNGNRWGVNINYLKEKERLGTAGPLSLIEDEFDEPLLVINGDVLTKVNFKSMIEFHLENQADLTMAVKQHMVEVPFGVVEVKNYELTGLSEKPLLKFFINAGIYLLNSELRKLIPYNSFFDMTELINLLLKNKKRVCTFPLREYWVDIGVLSDYRRAIDDYESYFKRSVG